VSLLTKTKTERRHRFKTNIRLQCFLGRERLEYLQVQDTPYVHSQPIFSSDYNLYFHINHFFPQQKQQLWRSKDKNREKQWDMSKMKTPKIQKQVLQAYLSFLISRLIPHTILSSIRCAWHMSSPHLFLLPHSVENMSVAISWCRVGLIPLTKFWNSSTFIRLPEKNATDYKLLSKES